MHHKLTSCQQVITTTTECRRNSKGAAPPPDKSQSTWNKFRWDMPHEKMAQVVACIVAGFAMFDGVAAKAQSDQAVSSAAQHDAAAAAAGAANPSMLGATSVSEKERDR